MTRYARRRCQRSRIWRKRRAHRRKSRALRNYVNRCKPKGPSLPNVDTSLKMPLLQRIASEVGAALARRRTATTAKQNHQQQQAR